VTAANFGAPIFNRLTVIARPFCVRHNDKIFSEVVGRVTPCAPFFSRWLFFNSAKTLLYRLHLTRML